MHAAIILFGLRASLAAYRFQTWSQGYDIVSKRLPAIADEAILARSIQLIDDITPAMIAALMSHDQRRLLRRVHRRRGLRIEDVDLIDIGRDKTQQVHDKLASD